MKYKFLSVVAGTESCMAECPFCVSAVRDELLPEPEINTRNLLKAVHLAKNSGIDTAMITSRGEPMLYPEMITKYLEILGEAFPITELQTNGVLIPEKTTELKKWYEMGLTIVNISIVHYDNEINKNIYGKRRKNYNLSENIKRLKDLGFTVRISCVMCKGWIDSPCEVDKLITFAKENNVDQLTLRPVNIENRRQSAELWINDKVLSYNDKLEIQEFLTEKGTQLLVLERIGVVYDYKGQNVCLSVPLDYTTRDTNPENARQLIFFPNGSIRYEWEKEGSRLI